MSSLALSRRLKSGFLASFGGLIWLFVWAGQAHAYPWPLHGATDAPQGIRQTVGAYRATNRLHAGVDVFATDGDTRVYSVEAGWTSGKQGTGDNEGIRIGSILYMHVHVAEDLEEGDVEPGTLLGTYFAPADAGAHVHLADGTDDSEEEGDVLK